MRKVIISCAITESMHRRSMSPHAGDAGGDREEHPGAAEAGAAIVHLHARISEDDRSEIAPPHEAP
jgi:uncharacterized protein (DUF849 family)